MGLTEATVEKVLLVEANVSAANVKSGAAARPELQELLRDKGH
jgi:hypothetical protein